ncbi:MAG: hypothetical protein JWP87_5259 [Labilithrix sp.]|nr:hypothetical protein [Labilithrix sp.]
MGVRKLVLALAITMAPAASIGCKHSGSKLEGHWRGTRADGVSAAQDAANAFATSTEITARGNVITVSTPSSKGQQGTFVVDSENANTVVLHTDKDGPANKETFAFSDDGKTMVWRLGEGRTITFQKIKE